MKFIRRLRFKIAEIYLTYVFDPKETKNKNLLCVVFRDQNRRIHDLLSEKMSRELA